MKTGEAFFGRRIRQNHALEHATITILSGMIPDLRVSARSSSNGFIIFGDVDLGLLRRAVDEALRRIDAGGGGARREPPPCGKYFAGGGALRPSSTVACGCHLPRS